MKRTPIHWLADRLLELSGLILLVMMLHVCADVGMKYLFNSPIQGTLEIVSYYYVVGAVFLPIAFVELTRASVSVDLFFAMLPKTLQVVCIALVLLVCAAVYGGLAWITWLDALRSLSRNEVVMGPVTVVVWPSRFVLPASFMLGAFACLWHLGRLVLLPAARDELIAPHQAGEEI